MTKKTRLKAVTIKMSKSDAKGLVKAWEGHIINNTEIKYCKMKITNCPVHKFFMKLKKLGRGG